MKMLAELKLVYSDERLAKSVASALGPDNVKVPQGLKVATNMEGRKVVSRIELDGRMETLLATADDLLACTLAAEIVL